ncbi:ABC transporter ATP-binding protein [Lachnospiraceae bacterium CLA-AA-H215]|uniref:ABC transporter ATP-binding protein n=1 Tax=Hominifimenecus microfluidus TaxID=2885348 RepID=A0AAE3JFC1_9FIRM|nr:ABC transporter ATP-binding protein [Hominifimenecus microfluidus]MCC2230572.1 ABC transporter ATP-binding protein [Hominifimenecus microfluidus]
MSEKETLIEVKDLTVHYVLHSGTSEAVNHISLAMKKGETLGLVGETGAGKTTVALSIMGLLPVPPAQVKSGEIIFEGQDILKLSEKEKKKIRGNKISMIFQDPMTALNPIDRVGDQIAEGIMLHQSVSRKEAMQKACDIMEMVGIPAVRYSEYPHQFSGGMKQRIVIAMALVCNPELLIADEPTTALDVTIQAQVLDMINQLKKKLGTSILLITHDFGVVAEMCERVAVIYAGEIVEAGTLEQIFEFTSHPYTQGLFQSLPSLEDSKAKLIPIPGMMPDPADLPEGCKFADRCPVCEERCRKTLPPLAEMEPEHLVRCFRPLKAK